MKGMNNASLSLRKFEFHVDVAVELSGSCSCRPDSASAGWFDVVTSIADKREEDGSISESVGPPRTSNCTGFEESGMLKLINFCLHTLFSEIYWRARCANWATNEPGKVPLLANSSRLKCPPAISRSARLRLTSGWSGLWTTRSKRIIRHDNGKTARILDRGCQWISCLSHRTFVPLYNWQGQMFSFMDSPDWSWGSNLNELSKFQNRACSSHHTAFQIKLLLHGAHLDCTGMQKAPR